MQGIQVHAGTAGQQTRAKEMSANPIYHCAGTDDVTGYTDWSYVCVGSYLQIEVTGSILTSAITGASYDANGVEKVNGTQYRRIKKSDVNNSYTGSDYFSWHGANDYYYFKWKRIKWCVLQNDGSALFVTGKRLDCEDYHDPGGSITEKDIKIQKFMEDDKIYEKK